MAIGRDQAWSAVRVAGRGEVMMDGGPGGSELVGEHRRRCTFARCVSSGIMGRRDKGMERGDRVLVKTSAGWWPGQFYRDWPSGAVAIDLVAVEGKRIPAERRKMQCDGGGTYVGVVVPQVKVAIHVKLVQGQRVVF